jgi:hypothetical protein
VRARLAALLGVIALAVVAPTASAASTPARDWVLLTLEAGPHGAKLRDVNVQGHFVPDGSDEVRVVGGAVAVAGKEAIAFLSSAGGGPLRVRGSRDVGGLDVTLVPAGSQDISGGTIGSPSVDLAPCEAAAFLLFVTGFTIDRASIDTVDDRVVSGSLESASVRSGTGSVVVEATDPQDAGAAMTAGPMAAGSSAHSTDAQMGLVGALQYGADAQETYTTPDGRSGTVHPATAAYASDFTFAGPPGRWTWTFAGVAPPPIGSFDYYAAIGYQSPAYAAFAPVGEDWPLFAPSEWKRLHPGRPGCAPRAGRSATPPAVRISHIPASLSAGRLERFTGTTSGRASAVEIALVRLSHGVRAARTQRSCLWLTGGRGTFRKRAASRSGVCDRPRWLRAKGTSRWRYDLGRHLPGGKYVLYARARAAGEPASQPLARSHAKRVRFRLVER